MAALDDPNSPRIDLFTYPATSSREVEASIERALDELGQPDAAMATPELFDSFLTYNADLLVSIRTGTLNGQSSVIIAEALRLEGETEATVFVMQVPADTYQSWGGLLAVLDAFDLVDNGTASLDQAMQQQIRAATQPSK